MGLNSQEVLQDTSFCPPHPLNTEMSAVNVDIAVFIISISGKWREHVKFLVGLVLLY